MTLSSGCCLKCCKEKEWHKEKLSGSKAQGHRKISRTAWTSEGPRWCDWLCELGWLEKIKAMGVCSYLWIVSKNEKKKIHLNICPPQSSFSSPYSIPSSEKCIFSCWSVFWLAIIFPFRSILHPPQAAMCQFGSWGGGTDCYGLHHPLASCWVWPMEFTSRRLEGKRWEKSGYFFPLSKFLPASVTFFSLEVAMFSTGGTFPKGLVFIRLQIHVFLPYLISPNGGYQLLPVAGLLVSLPPLFQKIWPHF